MEFIASGIAGLWIIEPTRHGDSRGYFCETFRKDMFEACVGRIDFIQENESLSRRGVLRGMHFQRGAMSQAKLVKVSRGAVLDVAVDLRPGSSTRGQYVMCELSAENGRQLFIPKGFAHGFLVLSDEALFQYKVDTPYAPETEMTMKFDDPDVAVAWPVDRDRMILSDKDLRGIAFRDLPEDLF